MSEVKKFPCGTHPNSLKNLTAAWTSETAREAQLKGAAKRTENARKRAEIKDKLKLLKSMQADLKDDHIDSVEVLRLIAYEKMEDGDMDSAVEIFKTLAEFERPKLARVESKVEEVKADEMSDEELQAKLKEMLKDGE